MSHALARPRLAPLLLTVFIDLLGFGLTIPLLPLYARSFGATALQVTLLGAAYSAMQFVFVPVWSTLSDRVGRRPVLLGSIAATAVSMALLGFARSYPELLLVRLLQGVATANIATAQAYIADVTEAEDRTRAMGMIGAAFGVGFVLGPFFGGVLAQESAALPGLAASALSVLNLGLAWRALPESRPASERAPGGARWDRVREQFAMRALRDAMRDSALGTLVVMSFLHVLSFTQLESTFALHLCARLGFGMRETGFAFALIGFVVVIVQGGVLGRVARRFGEVSLVRAGLAMLVVGLLAVSRLPSLVGPHPACEGGLPAAELASRSGLLVLALVVVSVGNALVSPSVSTLVSRVASRDGYGAVLGAQQSAGALARVIGPTFAGVVFERFGSASPYWFASAGMVAALALASSPRVAGIARRTQ
ncbi:MAG: MFS transporter [Polyangiales bacterium]